MEISIPSRMRFKRIIFDENILGPKWLLRYEIQDKKWDSDNMHELKRTITFNAETPEDALKRSLKILKRAANGMGNKREFFYAELSPTTHPNSTFKEVSTDYLFRLKYKEKYRSKSSILRCRNPRKIFVQGYGENAIKALSAS